jgi:hypothetical protein
MTDTLSSEQAYRLGFLGYGNPASRVWFVGMEEGGEWGVAQPSAHQVLHMGDVSATYDPVLPVAETRESSVWRISRQLAQAVGAGDDYFLSNMAPFPRPSLRSPLPGIHPVTYDSLVREVRIPWLITLLRGLRPAAAVFHGKSAWRRYGVRESIGLPVQQGHLLLYPAEGLAFAPFFTRRHGILSEADIGALTGFLRSAVRTHKRDGGS